MAAMAVATIDSQHDLSQHMPLGEALMSLCGVRQIENSGDGNLQMRSLHSKAEGGEFPDARDRIIRNYIDSWPLLRHRLHSVRISKPAPGLDRFEPALE